MTETADAPEAPQLDYVLRLFISGSTPASTTALEGILRICEEDLPGQYELQVVDAYQQPQSLAADDIVALPTLVRLLPGPVRKLVGDMTDRERVLIGLDVKLRPTRKPL